MTLAVTMTVRELTTDRELSDAFPLMSELRSRVEPNTFVAEIRREQVEGYRLFGGFAGAELVALAGVRRSHTLARGEHLFVDDLVTTARRRGQGHGRALLAALARRAAAEGITVIYLDSRDTARGFYEKVGFEVLTSLPCRIDVAKLVKDR